MDHYLPLKTMGLLIAFLLPGAHHAVSQYSFEVRLDSSEFLTDPVSETGRDLKIQASKDRMVVFDYENFRLLFYMRDTLFDDSQIIKIVGEFALTQENKPFNPVSNNRLSAEFSGTIFRDTLWISNYSFREILRFDLDGNYLNTIPGKYRILEADDSTLYAFEYKQIYRFDAASDSFLLLKDLPEDKRVDSEKYGANFKIGSDRLCVNAYDSLHVYNLTNFLSSDTASRLFSKTGESIADFEIIGDSIFWATDYRGNYRLCDLDGHDIDSGKLNIAMTTCQFTGDMLYLSNSGRMMVLTRNLEVLDSRSKDPFYLAPRFLGADSANIYFYDFRDGGFRVAPIDRDSGVFHYDPENEIPYDGWYYGLRISDGDKYLFSEWPPDSFKLYRFDTDAMTARYFEVDSMQDFDVFTDSIYTIRGTELKVYLTDGQLVATHTLSNLDSSNLLDIDPYSTIEFAVNAENIFIGFEGKLNVLDHAGVFEKMYDFGIENNARLFASAMEVHCTAPLNSIDIVTGNVFPYMPDSAWQRGFVFKDLYWYQSGTNRYSYIAEDLVGVGIHAQQAAEHPSLYQNYPNPFSSVTSIAFELPQEGLVTVEVFNMQGRRMAILLHERKPAGRHTVEFNGEGIEPGLYLYRISTGETYQVGKMLMVK